MRAVASAVLQVPAPAPRRSAPLALAAPRGQAAPLGSRHGTARAVGKGELAPRCMPRTGLSGRRRLHILRAQTRPLTRRHSRLCPLHTLSCAPLRRAPGGRTARVRRGRVRARHALTPPRPRTGHGLHGRGRAGERAHRGAAAGTAVAGGRRVAAGLLPRRAAGAPPRSGPYILPQSLAPAARKPSSLGGTVQPGRALLPAGIARLVHGLRTEPLAAPAVPRAPPRRPAPAPRAA